MAQYIDKDALVAEIERRRKLVSDPILSGDDLMIGERNALFNLLSFIDTLEVKEVNLENEKCKDLNDDGTCIYAFNKTGKVMRCDYIKCSRKIKAQKGE